jgi:hypothetical protein
MNNLGCLILFCAALVLFSGCAHRSGGGSAGTSPPGVIENDPTFSFVLPTTKCDGMAGVAGVGVNIYGVQGPGPMATVAVTGNAQVACNGNKIDATKAVKLNVAPITVATGTLLGVSAPGQWTFCAEAQDPAGNRSLIGDCLTKNVSADPAKPTNMIISGMEIKIMSGAVEPRTGFKISKASGNELV